MSERDSLFSVDVEAHLRKVASRGWSSPSRYVVELVREAVRRHACEVRVDISSRKVVITDDGVGLGEEVRCGLVTLLDPAAAVEAREEAMAALTGERGPGLLSVFAPAPRRVEIATAGGKGWTLEARAGGGTRSRSEGPVRGTVVTVERGGDAAVEREALLEHCRYASVPIFVDGRRLAPWREVDLPLVSARVPALAGTAGGHVWIPSSGDLCRVACLDQGILWKQTVFETGRHGLVFEAALETEDASPRALARLVREAVRGLYAGLVAEFVGLPPGAQERVEELIFLLLRRHGDRSLVAGFAPFREAGSGRRLTLAEVEQEAKLGRLAGLRAGDRRERYDCSGRTVLELSAREWEFLADVAGLWLPPPRLRPAPRGLGERVRSWLGAWWDRVAVRLARTGAAELRGEELTAAERKFIDLLRDRLGCDVAMVDRGGWRPAVRVAGAQGWRFRINRRHRTVSLAVKLVYGEGSWLPLAAALVEGVDRRPGSAKLVRDAARPCSCAPRDRGE